MNRLTSGILSNWMEGLRFLGSCSGFILNEGWSKMEENIRGELAAMRETITY
jgi:hypothetical protein